MGDFEIVRCMCYLCCTGWDLVGSDVAILAWEQGELVVERFGMFYSGRL